MHLHTTIPVVVFLARASAQLHRMEFPNAIRPLAANCPATADMPKCAINCIDTAAADNGCASSTDLVCQCKNYSKIQKAAAPCIIAACAAKAPDVISIASEICSQCAGIPVAAAPVMRETIVIDDAAVARINNNANNYFQWAAEPTGRVVVPRRNGEQDSAGEDSEEEAAHKKWGNTVARMAVAGVAVETGRPVLSRKVFDEEIGSVQQQQAERKEWSNSSKMPRNGMLLEEVTESESKQRLVARKGPELSDFSSDKSPELPDFGHKKSELRPFNKDCSATGKEGSESWRSCGGERDWDNDNHVEGREDLAAGRMRSNTWAKRKVDYIFEKEQERLILEKEKEEEKMMLDKEGRMMNKESEQKKWI